MLNAKNLPVRTIHCQSTLVVSLHGRHQTQSPAYRKIKHENFWLFGLWLPQPRQRPNCAKRNRDGKHPRSSCCRHHHDTPPGHLVGGRGHRHSLRTATRCRGPQTREDRNDMHTDSYYAWGTVIWKLACQVLRWLCVARAAIYIGSFYKDSVWVCHDNFFYNSWKTKEGKKASCGFFFRVWCFVKAFDSLWMPMLWTSHDFQPYVCGWLHIQEGEITQRHKYCIHLVIDNKYARTPTCFMQ
jgi:hypothetical protein